MMDKKTGAMAAGMLACVLAGAGVERVRHYLTSVPDEPEAPVEELVASVNREPGVPRTVVVKDEAAERAAEALRKRVAELEAALAERAQEPLKPKEEEQPDRTRRPSFTERLERMKTENPEEYAEMQKRREEFRQNMEQRAAERADFIASVDTKNMTAAQKENHAKLVETVAFLNEMMGQARQPGVEHTPETRQQIGEAFGTLGELYGEERRFLFEETARSVGFQGAQAVDFADQMQVIIDNTTMPNFGGRRGGRGGPPAPIPTPAPAN